MSDLTSTAIFTSHPPSGSEGLRPNSILSEALLQNEHVKAVRFVFAAGQELSEHAASVPAMIHQVSGKAEWDLDGKVHEASPGDWAYMPPSLKHTIKAVEDCVFLLLLLKGGAK